MFFEANTSTTKEARETAPIASRDLELLSIPAVSSLESQPSALSPTSTSTQIQPNNSTEQAQQNSLGQGHQSTYRNLHAPDFRSVIFRDEGQDRTAEFYPRNDDGQHVTRDFYAVDEGQPRTNDLYSRNEHQDRTIGFHSRNEGQHNRTAEFYSAAREE